MLDHHLWLTGQILDRAGRLDDAVLDRPIELSVEGIDAGPTLRSLTTRLVTQLEMWLGALGGARGQPPPGRRRPTVTARRPPCVPGWPPRARGSGRSCWARSRMAGRRRPSST